MTRAEAVSEAGAPTLQQRIDAAQGRTSGFDVLRIALAVAVVCVHAIGISYGAAPTEAAWTGPFRGVISCILPMFFALSGFLVAGSLERVSGLGEFFTLRALRIVPALLVETFLCALLLGPLLTTVPLAVYFRDPQFFSYFLNIIGKVQFHLPGMFPGLPGSTVVNGSLWTVPYELKCYAALGLLALLGVVERRRLLLALVIGACVLGPLFLETPAHFGRPTGALLVVSFLCGLAISRFRDVVPFRASWFALSLPVAALCFSWPVAAYWGAPFAAYATVWLGLLRAPKIPLLMNGDYSYGLYLFAFPMQQTESWLFPHAREWIWNVGFALACGMLYAAFSWHCVEKPILRHRKKVVAFVNRALGVVGGAVANFAAPLRRSRAGSE